jgi:hypothetical protein
MIPMAGTSFRSFLGAALLEKPCGLSCGPAEGRLDQIRAP